jgi:hypothetical protein
VLVAGNLVLTASTVSLHVVMYIMWSCIYIMWSKGLRKRNASIYVEVKACGLFLIILTVVCFFTVENIIMPNGYEC